MFGERGRADEAAKKAKTNGKKTLGVVEKEEASVAIVFPLSRSNARQLCEKCAWNGESTLSRESAREELTNASTRTWSPRGAEQKQQARFRFLPAASSLMSIRPLLLRPLLLLPQQARRRLSTSPTASAAAARAASCLFGQRTTAHFRSEKGMEILDFRFKESAVCCASVFFLFSASTLFFFSCRS